MLKIIHLIPTPPPTPLFPTMVLDLDTNGGTLMAGHKRRDTNGGTSFTFVGLREKSLAVKNLRRDKKKIVI